MARFQSRLPASLYVAGPFAMGYTEFYNFLIPLYGFSLGLSAGLPAAAVVLALAAAAGDQWWRAAVCLVGFADLDRPIGRRRGRVSRAIQLLRAHRHDRGADDCRSGVGFWRRLARLRARLCLGCRADLGASPRP